jgi:hypothetical protein
MTLSFSAFLILVIHLQFIDYFLPATRATPDRRAKSAAVDKTVVAVSGVD